MPMPNSGQSFPQASNSSGGMISKIFGGIGSAYQLRNQAQLALYVHGQRAAMDTAEQDKRQASAARHAAAGKIATEGGLSENRMSTMRDLSKALNASPTVTGDDGKEVHNPDYIDTRISSVGQSGINLQNIGRVEYSGQRQEKTKTDNTTNTGTPPSTPSGSTPSQSNSDDVVSRTDSMKSTKPAVPMPNFSDKNK